MGRHIALLSSVGAAVLLGASAGSAYAYFTARGSGTVNATAGTPTTVTVNAVAGSADLLPGGTGTATFTLTDSNPLAVSFTSVASASVVSNDTNDCPSNNVTVAKTLPYALSPALGVNANSTSGTLSIPGFVQLASTAPSGCQGVTFTVTIALSGATP